MFHCVCPQKSLSWKGRNEKIHDFITLNQIISFSFQSSAHCMIFLMELSCKLIRLKQAFETSNHTVFLWLEDGVFSFQNNPNDLGKTKDRSRSS